MNRILSGGVAAGSTIMLSINGMKLDVTVTNTGIDAVTGDVKCTIGGMEIILDSGRTLNPNVPTPLSKSLSAAELIMAYFDGKITYGTYDVTFEAFFNGVSVDSLTLPGAVTFAEPSAEGGLSNAVITVI